MILNLYRGRNLLFKHTEGVVHFMGTYVADVLPKELQKEENTLQFRG